MYERMLNKQVTPTFDDLIHYSGQSGVLWLTLDKNLKDKYKVSTMIRFPYGKEYGWGVKYSVKSKHICDVFAEDGAFSVLMQISSKAMGTVIDDLGDYAKDAWANMYPCTSGGWIDFRVLNEEHLQDIEKIIQAKITAPKK